MMGLSAEGLSIEERAEAASEAADGLGTPKLGLLEVGVDLKLQACEAALEASGRDLGALEVLDDVGFFSFPGRNVRSILPFFSGDGVRDFSSDVTAGDSVDPLRIWVKLFSRIEPLPEGFRGAMPGR